MTIQDLKDNNLILLEAISGSKAYGLSTPESDTDIKGVFAMPKSGFYGMGYVVQVNDESNDVVYYELGRFIEFLTKNNPNIVELLNTPEDCVLLKHPLIDLIEPEMFLSKLCRQTFGNYAMTQVKKARGLNKKILNPVDKERKSILDFCYIAQGQGTVPLKLFLSDRNIRQEDCGLAKLPHMHEMYGLYHTIKDRYKGVAAKDDSNEVSLSSIQKGEVPIAYMSFNKSGYSSYCKEYKEYWEWVGKRNEARYKNTLSHGKNYDAKNMMHTFRLLAMAKEIGEEGRVNVRRTDRDFLLDVKQGKYEYDELVSRAEQKAAELDDIYSKSDLQDAPEMEKANELLVRFREALYG